MPEQPPLPPEKKRPIFEPTINLGHVLTFIGFIGMGFGAYSNLEKRITLLEHQALAFAHSTTDQERRLADSMREMKADLKEVRRSIDDINRNITRGR